MSSEGKSGSSCSRGVVECSRFGPIAGSRGRSYDPSGTGCPAFFAHVLLRRNQLPTRRGFALREIAHDRLDLIEGMRGSARQIDQSSSRTELWRRSFACRRGRATSRAAANVSLDSERIAFLRNIARDIECVQQRSITNPRTEESDGSSMLHD